MHLDKNREKLDKIGAITSFACAIHCAFMPILLTVLPLVALSAFANETFELVLFGLSAALAIFSICWGYKTHKSKRVLAVLACGLAILATGRIMHQHHSHNHPILLTASGEINKTHNHYHGFDQYTIFLVIGGLLVTTSHIVNYKLCKSCKICNNK